MFDYSQWRTQAQGRVNATGVPDAVFGAAVTKNAGLGSYRLTIFDAAVNPPLGAGIPVPANRMLLFVTAIGATPRLISANDVDDNAKDVLIADDLGALVDQEFVFILGYFLPAG